MNADSNVKKPDIEDDSATGEKLVYNKSDTNAERIIFLLFTAFFLVIVFTQMSISDTFDVNDYANQYVLNVQNATSFLSLHTLSEFQDVYIGLLKQSVDNTWYDTYTINNNEKMLVSNIRLTQRRISLKDNDNPISKRYIKKMWSDSGISYDSNKQSYEETSTYGSGSQFVYNQKDSYEGLGGYVITFKDTDNVSDVQTVLNNKWLDDQTASLLTDFIFYAPYKRILVYIRLVLTVHESGNLLTSIETDSLRLSYYGDSLSYFRAFCECCFMIISFFYVARKIYEIYQEYLTIQKKFFKDKKKQERIKREERKRILAQTEGQEEEKVPNNNDQENEENNEIAQHEEESESKGKCLSNMTIGNGLLCLSTTGKGMFKFLSNPWNFIDCANIIILLISIIVWIIFIANQAAINMSSLDYFKNSSNNHDILYCCNLLIIYQRTVSINLILISLKFLKYLGAMFERVTVMFKVLSHAWSDILYFFILYLIIFISFTTTFHIFYGSQVERFSTYGDSFNTLFLYLGRNILQINEMKDMSFNFTVFYFIIFITSMEFILMNMFIAIIALSYSTVNKQLKEKGSLEKILSEKHLLVRLHDFYTHVTKIGCLAKLWQCRKRRQKAKDSENNDAFEHSNEESAHDQNLPQKNTAKDLSPDKSDKKKLKDKSEVPNAAVELNQIKLNLEENKDPLDEEDEDDHHNKKLKKAIESNGESSTKKPDSSYEGASEIKSETEKDDESVIDSQINEDNPENQKKLEKTDEEKEEERQLLLKMEWNQHFDPNYFIDDDNADDVLQSEKQIYERQVKREKKYGRDLWALISYIAFFAIYSYLVFEHVRVSMFNMYNDALQNNIEGVTILVGDQYQNITQVSSFEEISDWLTTAYTYVFDTTLTSDSGKTYYFVNDYNFVLANSCRLCFSLAKQNNNPNGDGGPRPRVWRRLSDDSDSIYTDTFTGNYSGFTYEYTSDGFQGSGSYCRQLDVSNIDSDMQNFVNDYLIGERMFFLSLEFVTFEASNYFYTYNSILFEILNNGEISTTLDIASLDVLKYHEWYDWVRLVFEIIFILTIIYMIYNFVKSIVNKLKLYSKWEVMEIKTLSAVEKEQRHNNEPEFIRKIKAVVNFFTFFEVLFYLFSLVIIIMWIILITKFASLNIIYDSNNRAGMYNNFYNVKQLFDAYKVILSLASICISFNLLSHAFMLNHCLADSKLEIIYFLIFYILLILGFVSVAYLTFGPYLKEYKTFGDSLVECFSIILGDFNYLDLEKVDSAMAVLFFYPYNLIFVFILANMLLAIMNTAYIESNAKKKSTPNKVRWLRVIFYCFFKDVKASEEDEEGNSSNLKNSENKNNIANINERGKETDAPEYLENLKKLGIYSRKEDDYKLWAINCAEEIRQENIDRAKLKKAFYDELEKSTAKNSEGYDIGKVIEARINYWNYLCKAIQVIDLQNGVIEYQNKKLIEKLNEKNKEYEIEKEKTNMIYKYISMLEEPVAKNLQLLKLYLTLKQKLDEKESLG